MIALLSCYKKHICSKDIIYFLFDVFFVGRSSQIDSSSRVWLGWGDIRCEWQICAVWCRNPRQGRQCHSTTKTQCCLQGSYAALQYTVKIYVVYKMCPKTMFRASLWKKAIETSFLIAYFKSIRRVIRLNKKFLCLKACDRLEDLTLNVFFFFFFFTSPPPMSSLSHSQPLSSMKCGTWFLDEQDTRLK